MSLRASKESLYFQRIFNLPRSLKAFKESEAYKESQSFQRVSEFPKSLKLPRSVKVSNESHCFQVRLLINRLISMEINRIKRLINNPTSKESLNFHRVSMLPKSLQSFEESFIFQGVLKLWMSVKASNEPHCF